MSDQTPQYPQQPSGAPQPESNRKSWPARHKFLTAIGVIIVLGIIGSATGGGSSEDTANTAVTGSTSDDTASSTPTEEAATAPEDDATTQAPAAKPAGNVIGNWAILTKHPKFGEAYGMFDSVKIDVKNISDSEDEPWLEIRLTKGNRLVTTFDCIGQTVRPGEVTTLDCSSMDDYAPWTDYEIKNAF